MTSKVTNEQRQEGHGGGARRAEATIDSDTWWPSEPERLVAILQSGGTLTRAEREVAGRELEAREQRIKTPPVIRREDVDFEPSSLKGIEIGTIIAPYAGMDVRLLSLEIHRLLPGAHSEARRANEAAYHILNGRGYSLIDDKRYDWGPHDSIHVPLGSWQQHFNLDDARPAHLLACQPSPLLEHISPYAQVFKGDSFSDPPDEYQPEHPFTGERVSVGYVGGEKWMSHLQMAIHDRRAAREQVRRAARVLLPASEAVIERSQHRGDWKVGLIDRHLGFDNRILGMYVHQLPPASYTETHKHDEAIVYVLSGQGYSIVDGDRFDWRAGDTIFVKTGQWHQHFNSDPELVSQHIAMYTQPLKEHVFEDAQVVELRPEAEYQPAPNAHTVDNWWE